ncbi:hypothetical protein CYMTET_27003, partial [Cymbomonas tetramitiformis]
MVENPESERKGFMDRGADEPLHADSDIVHSMPDKYRMLEKRVLPCRLFSQGTLVLGLCIWLVTLTVFALRHTRGEVTSSRDAGFSAQSPPAMDAEALKAYLDSHFGDVVDPAKHSAGHFLPYVDVYLKRGPYELRKLYGSVPGTNAPLPEEPITKLFSVTKLWTHTTLMKLYDLGRIDLDAPVARYLPEFREDPANPASKPKEFRVIKPRGSLPTSLLHAEDVEMPDWIHSRRACDSAVSCRENCCVDFGDGRIAKIVPIINATVLKGTPLVDLERLGTDADGVTPIRIFYDTEPANRPIRVRDVLSHSSGLAYNFWAETLPSFDFHAPSLPVHAHYKHPIFTHQYAAATHPGLPPETLHKHYSTFGTLLDHALGRVTTSSLIANRISSGRIPAFWICLGPRQSGPMVASGECTLSTVAIGVCTLSTVASCVCTIS